MPSTYDNDPRLRIVMDALIEAPNNRGLTPKDRAEWMLRALDKPRIYRGKYRYEVPGSITLDELTILIEKVREYGHPIYDGDQRVLHTTFDVEASVTDAKRALTEIVHEIEEELRGHGIHDGPFHFIEGPIPLTPEEAKAA